MEAIINNLIKAIGWSILHSLWQGAIIFAVLFIALAVKPKMSARIKHNLSMGALFLIFIGFCLTFASLFNLPSKAAASTANLELNGAALEQIYNFTHSWSFKTESYFPFIVAFYVIGISFQLVVLVSGYIKLKKLKQSHISAMPNDWLNVAENTLLKLGITKKVQFFLSETVNVPLAVGFLKPVVLFPIALVTQLDIKQVEAILIHELSHIRRNDYILNLLKTGIETLLFFNPFVWLTTRFIHIEREHACDDLVVKFTNSPITYAHALLKLELIKNKTQPALSLAATGKNQHLYQRIKRITDMKTNYMNAKQKILALCLTLATVASLAWINPTKTETAKVKNKNLTTVAHIISNTDNEKKLISLAADTDTVKRKVKREIIIRNKDGKKTVYNSIDEMPDSLKVKLADVEKMINSPEWKENLAKVESNAEEMTKMFESKEWKNKMAKIEFDASKMEKMFNSKEWKENMAKIEFNSKQLEKKFNSPEWKKQMAKIELDASKMEKMFNSKEWKENMAKIEFNSKELEKKFNSPEWKAKMDKIEFNTKELDKKFNSPEWKKKMKELEELEKSPEYKQLREKYEKEVEELKKKKGISTDKAFLIYDGSNPMQIAALPHESVEAIKKAFLSSPKAIAKLEALAETQPIK
ncbi:M56 family metallopeptidase [Pedobacter xixiisoli]|uniref:Signal transducer regulating beta-lactamase production, contains metallopeptidase domain n=1 Tax=Pedobacter xixiisoli TaxID=1476464 RepID=A0A285ZYW7_9SPHI|nr:M56 family metallopeptidase [Pedobacter xixiisoli]SOD14843.1 Signal transducer regulating beta-lactamase production, contains metallopeptidase domain [Pedobacter xixiisoli]